jgi:hypothetical protein
MDRPCVGRLIPDGSNTHDRTSDQPLVMVINESIMVVNGSMTVVNEAVTVING